MENLSVCAIGGGLGLNPLPAPPNPHSAYATGIGRVERFQAALVAVAGAA